MKLTEFSEFPGGVETLEGYLVFLKGPGSQDSDGEGTVSSVARGQRRTVDSSRTVGNTRRCTRHWEAKPKAREQVASGTSRERKAVRGRPDASPRSYLFSPLTA